jgi:hypothetical protein
MLGTPMSDLVEKLRQVEEQLDAYKERIGLNIPNLIENNIQDCLSLTRKQLAKTPVLELAGMKIEIGAFLVYLQGEYNKHKSRYNWCENELNRCVAKVLNEYPGYSFQERRLAAIYNGDYTEKVEALRIRTQLALDNLDFVVARLESFKKDLETYIYTARGVEKNG